jgi:hypothetical protein
MFDKSRMNLANNSRKVKNKAFQKWNGGTIDRKATIHKGFSRSMHRSTNGTIKRNH